VRQPAWRPQLKRGPLGCFNCGFLRPMSWRRLILDHQSDFLKWVDATDTRMRLLISVSGCLETYLTGRLQSQDDCIQFWNAIPLVRTACNFSETYELPFAAEAYAYVHTLDRYWRTWDALIELTIKGALPVGAEGVRILDVGTGPLPTPYAFQDFYQQLRLYGDNNRIAELASQNTHFGIVESSSSMRRLMHWLSEHCQRPGPYGADITDFAEVNPPATRKELEQSLRRREYYDASVDDYYYEYTTEEANFIANRHQRYRMVIFSNFFTVDHVIDQFEKAITALFADLSSGAVVMILGGTGGQYKKVYSRLIELAQNSGLRRLTELDGSLGAGTQAARAQEEIKKRQHAVYRHLLRIVSDRQLPEALVTSDYPYAEFANQIGLDLPPTIRWPDYWNPAPFPGKRVEFSLHVFRKGKWPR
jgi:hypothetical protein